MEFFDTSVITAFIGGLASFLSPCLLPLIPAYLCLITGETLESLTEKNTPLATVFSFQVFIKAVVFVLGFSTIFIILGATASLLHSIVFAYKHWGYWAAGTVLIVLGVHFTGLFTLPFLNKTWQGLWQQKPKPKPKAKSQNSLGTAYLTGLAFAFGWTPCIGPILAGILTLAATKTHLTQGVTLLAFYALGLGLPFIIASLCTVPLLGFIRRFQIHFRKVQLVAGSGLILTGVFMLTGHLEKGAFYLLELFPGLATLG